LRSSFESNKSTNKGFTFGASNKTYEKVYNECLPEKKGWTEPGLYNIASFADKVKTGKKKIFFGEKCYESLERKKVKSPGPGSYNDTHTESLNRVGKYSNSKHLNSLS
jgi:hypothetical protein